MATSLLTTKLYVPPVRPGAVPRPRLIERLNAGLFGQGSRFARKLTIISAPAGFGKTTLLAEWVTGCGLPIAWLSLDEGDNDPARFLAYLIAALQTVEGDTGKGVPDTVHFTGSIDASRASLTEDFLTALINQISAIPASFPRLRTKGPRSGQAPRPSPGQVVLVLDDYHLVTAQPIHNALAFFLEHLPGNMHLVIATRADPPLPIARLRGRGQLTELRQADLRFTPDEVVAFLNQSMGLQLSADDISTLASRTEGWVAGLQMAAIALRSLESPQSQGSMRRQQGRAGFIQAFTGGNRYVLDYLVEEVLQQQPVHIQTFLLQTSTLDRLTGPLCDAVLEMSKSADRQISKSASRQLDGRTSRSAVDLQTCRFADLSGQEILEYLERANLFIVPLDNERRWYRYHRLFADLLRQRLHQTQPDLVPTLHGRAGAWHEQNGPMASAIDHALSAGDLEWAADLIEQEAEATLMRGEIVTLLRWVDVLPAELARLRPSLCAYHAWALLMSGRPWETIRSRLKDIDQDAERIPGKAAPLRAWIALFQGQISRAAELARQALEQLPEDDLFLRSVAIWSLALYSADDDIVAGTQALKEAARACQEAGNVAIAAMMLCNLAELTMKQGHLRQAQATYQQALDLAVDVQGRRLPIAGDALIGLGDLAREWNDLEMATRYLTEGIGLASQLGQARALEGYIYLAHVRQAQGDANGAREAIQEARRLAIEFDATEFDDIMVGFHQAQLWITQRNLNAARRWTEERGLDDDIESSQLQQAGDLIQSRMRQYNYLVLARLLIAEKRPTQALALLDGVLPTMERRGRIGRVIEIQVLRSLAFQALGDVTRAMDALERALSLAEPGGYVRLFVDAGEPVGELLQQAAARGIAVGYANRLLAALQGETKDERRKMDADSSPVTRPSSSLVEPLSEREIEVLRLLTTSLSSTEIADELVISVNTVRSHVKSIYAKLGVHSRYEALARAKELNLL